MRLLPLAGCVLTFGCNNGKQLQADLYQRELRLQEDEIYRLEDYIEQYQGMLRGYRCEVASLKRQLSQSEKGEPSPVGPEFKPGAAPKQEEPESEAPEFLPAPDAHEAPVFTPETPTDEAPPFDAGAADSIPRGTKLASLESEPAPTPALLKLGEVDSLRLDIRNGHPAEGGEPTLLAALTPMSEGEAAYFEGEASVLLAEIPREGPMRRIARWDFNADEVEASWSESDGAARIELPLLVPEEAAQRTPVDQPLRVWVRLVDSRGRKTLRSIEARFTGEPFGIVYEAPAIAAKSRRLPLVATQEPASVEQKQEKARDWRRATPGLYRQRMHDTALAPASFEAPLEEKGRGAEWRGAATR